MVLNPLAKKSELKELENKFTNLKLRMDELEKMLVINKLQEAHEGCCQNEEGVDCECY